MLLHRIRSFSNLYKNTKIKFKNFSTNKSNNNHKSNYQVAYLMSAIAISIFGLSYASVPLYKMFCQMTGLDE